MLDQHFNVLLFSNPGDKVLTRWKTRGQICPYFQKKIRPLSLGLENNNTLKCWPVIFPTTLIFVGKQLEQHFNAGLFFNPRDNILVLVEILWSQDLRVQLLHLAHFLNRL